MQVKLVSALIKKNEDAFSKNDPYVKFKLGDEEHCSKVKEEGGNKVLFNEMFHFKGHDDMLTVTVYDDDFLIDDKLGEGQVSVGQYRNSQYPQNVEVIAQANGQPTCKVFLQISGGQGGQFGGQGGNQFGGQGNTGNTGNQAAFFGAAEQLGQGGQGGQGGFGGNPGQGQWGQGGQGQFGGQGGQGGQGQWGNPGGQGGQGGQGW